jgi:hypothetical protein
LTTLERRRPVTLGVVDDIAVECSATVPLEPPAPGRSPTAAAVALASVV